MHYIPVNTIHVQCVQYETYLSLRLDDPLSLLDCSVALDVLGLQSVLNKHVSLDEGYDDTTRTLWASSDATSSSASFLCSSSSIPFRFT